MHNERMSKLVADLGEKKILQGLKRFLGKDGGILRTFSEDCAVVESGGSNLTLYTVDSFVEGVHFKFEHSTPCRIGRKALKINISDISAMGGKPEYYLVSLGLTPNISMRDVKELYRGMASVAKPLGMKLLGGNLSASSNAFVDIFVTGVVSKKQALCRNGARVRDYIFVTGPLGGSALGLQLLKSGIHARSTAEKRVIQSHLDPPCRNDVARLLASWNCLTSMMDLSDGLASDLNEICRESGVGAAIQKEQLPIARHVDSLARTMGMDPIALALKGGEDYELLFTVSAQKHKAFLKLLKSSKFSAFEIGRIVPKRDAVSVVDSSGRQNKLKGGYEHFKTEHSTAKSRR